MADPAASSISVTVRVRPFTIREAAQLTKYDDAPIFLGDGSLAGVATPKLSSKGLRSVIKVVDDRCLVFDPPEDSPVQRFSRSVIPASRRVKDQTFGFDKVFDENVSQADVYESTTRGLLDGVLEGYNATVFAYGATGCGKTHTITGTTTQPGIIFLTMQELFERIEERKGERHSEISLSYLEIYNETIRDLLLPEASKQGLALREDANQAVSVIGLSSHQPRNVEQVMEMILAGNENRTVSPTAANATSSRSHAVLQINVSSKDRNADVSEPHVMATLSIIDLAGSERASATLNKGARLTEGANINKSLLALGSCINALCDPRKKNHIPYRNSKLTRLLKFSLGGNCKTVMIVCVSPSSAHFDETQNTLRYANRAKNIQTKVTKNVYNVNRHVKDFLVKIDEQMALINELRSQQKDSEKIALAKFKKANEKKEVLVREGLERIRAAYDHSAGERQEKLKGMTNQRRVERRIDALMALTQNLGKLEGNTGPLHELEVAAKGQLVELEASRRHFRQKLSQNAWERNIDAALETGSRLVKEVDGHEQSAEAAALIKEAEILKARAEREIMFAVLEFDRAESESGFLGSAIASAISSLAVISQTLSLSQSEALSCGHKYLAQAQTASCNELWRMVRPGTEPRPVSPVKDWFSPTKNGTPRRKKGTPVRPKAERQPIPGSIQKMVPMKLVPPSPAIASAAASPRAAMASPKRRKIHTTGAAKRGVVIVSGTPKRNKPQSRKKGVTWKDDRPGTALAEFKAPAQDLTTPEQSRSPLSQELTVTQETFAALLVAPDSPRSRIPSPKPALRRTSRVRYDPQSTTADSADQPSSSPVPPLPQISGPVSTSSATRHQNEKMKMGFLQKKHKSPESPLTTLANGGLSSSDSEFSPLRELRIDHANARPAPAPSPHNIGARNLDGTADLDFSDASSISIVDENMSRPTKPVPRASLVSPSLARPSPLRKMNAVASDVESSSPLAHLNQSVSSHGTTNALRMDPPRLSIVEEQSVGLELMKAKQRRSSGSSTASASHDRLPSRRQSQSPPITEPDRLFSSGQARRMGALPAMRAHDNAAYLLSPRFGGNAVEKIGGSARKPSRRTTMLSTPRFKADESGSLDSRRIRESVGVIRESTGGLRSWR